jgi:hypothetical protein
MASREEPAAVVGAVRDALFTAAGHTALAWASCTWVLREHGGARLDDALWEVADAMMDAAGTMTHADTVSLTSMCEVRAVYLAIGAGVAVLHPGTGLTNQFVWRDRMGAHPSVATNRIACAPSSPATGCRL